MWCLNKYFKLLLINIEDCSRDFLIMITSWVLTKKLGTE